MAISFTTENRSASESLTEALKNIDHYNHSRVISYADSASRSLDAALKSDANFGLAIFYKGLVLDLMGKPADAPKFFERILKESASSELEIESLFNLGVANYHQYSHPRLKDAKRYFEEVIIVTKDNLIRNLAIAHLAQTHAMWMRPSFDQVPDKSARINDDVAEHIRKHYKKCTELAGDLKSREVTDRRVVATYQNALGMANMYYTDHLDLDETTVRHHLKKSRESLEVSDQFLGNDWANSCDIASNSLRFSVFERRCGNEKEMEIQFCNAETWLRRVVEDLRPNYGFALHELGILYRVWGKWDQASKYQNEALAIDKKYRDISDRTVKAELKRIAKEDSAYP